MGNKKISDLNLNSFPTLNDVFPIVNNGVTKKLTLDGLTNFISPYINVTGVTNGFDVYVTGGTYNSGSITFRNNTGGTFTVTGLSTSGTSYEPIITVSKAELDILISSNGLVSGKIYKITGVDVDLYGGTDVFLQALTDNQLSFDGFALFYNPKYNSDINGNGVWTNYISAYFQNTTGQFYNNEYIVSENGATGYYIVDGLIRWNSGVFSGTTTITGQSSGAYVQIENAYSPRYSINDKIIWGGKVWRNLTGEIGYTDDYYTLGNDWELINYNDTDYNLVLDQVRYDYIHDKIIGRKDAFNNELLCDYITIQKITEDISNPIKDFQWGNGKNNYGNGGKYYFNDCGSDNINDGGNDMYDGGNELYTDLDRIPYTHTQMVDCDEQASISDFLMNGSIVSSDTIFGTSSEYFTNQYPDLFVLAAKNITINEFKTEGNLGADGGGDYTAYTFTITGYTSNYTVFVKSVYNAYDPSVNHMFIVNTIDDSIIHDYATNTDDDYHSISNLSGVTEVYYMLSALGGGQLITPNLINQMVINFLNIIDNKSLNNILNDLNVDYLMITDILPPSLNQNSSGVIGNKIYNSYFNCLNFTGGYLWNNYLYNYSIINENVFASDSQSNIEYNVLENYSEISYNYLYNARIKLNKLNNSNINDNKLGSPYANESNIEMNVLFDSNMNSSYLIQSSYYENILNTNSSIYNNFLNDSYIENQSLQLTSYIQSNNLKNSGFSNNKLESNSYVNNNTFENSYLENNSFFVANMYNCTNYNTSIYYNNLLNNTFLYYNNFYSITFEKNTFINQSQIEHLSLTSSTISNNTFNSTSINFQNSGGMTGKNIQKTNFNNILTTDNLSNATILYSGICKNAMTRVDSTPVITYVDNSNVLQVALLTD